MRSKSSYLITFRDSEIAVVDSSSDSDGSEEEEAVFIVVKPPPHPLRAATDAIEQMGTAAKFVVKVVVGVVVVGGVGGRCD